MSLLDESNAFVIWQFALTTIHSTCLLYPHVGRWIEENMNGVVNDEFNRIYSLKKTREPDCVVKLIEEYIVDADTIISELSSLIDTPNVDVTKLGALARKLEEKSQRIGAEHMRAASADLFQAYGQMHKANFSQALAGVSNEFIYTKMKFEYFLKLEQKIIGERGEGSRT